MNPQNHIGKLILLLCLALSTKHTLAASALPTMPTGPEKTMTTSTGIELVWIPPGEFLLGGGPQDQPQTKASRLAAARDKRETGPANKATIRQGFWIGKTEITVGQWKQFVAATSYLTNAEKSGGTTAPLGPGKSWAAFVKGANWKDPNFGFKLKDNHPACCISWNDAVAFCQWLTETETKANKLPAEMICRLPTEAEWEYACRAGSQTKFWWGNSAETGLGRSSWYGNKNEFEFVSPVDHFGARGRNKFGLADMLGNVQEWCLDAYDPAGAHEDCYKGTSSTCVIKGGSIRDRLGTVGPANRSPQSTARSNADYGFRVAIGQAR